MKFIKMQALKNDYIIINNVQNNLETLKENKRKLITLCDRNLGVGANGIIFLEKAKIADYKITIFNKDATVSKTSGNGLLCVAKYLKMNNLIKKNAMIETTSGINYIEIEGEDYIKNIIINMNKAGLEPRLIPVLSEKNLFINENINILSRNYKMSCITVGNPYAIIFENNIDTINFNMISRAIQYNYLFPEKVNVVFAQIKDNKTIKIRIYEKGNEETKSCGSAACATVALYSIINNLKKNKEIKVEQKGGNFDISINENEEILLKGNSEYVYKGKILVK